MQRLAKSPTDIQEHYEVLVIGSGYGGSIAASRLARAGRHIGLFERGKEFLPGEYPDCPEEAAQEFQTNSPLGHTGEKNSLFNLQVDTDINVLHGCGLGGTSLINANVSIEMEPRVLDDPRWPQKLRGQPQELATGYSRARKMLQPQAYPDSFPSLKKTQAHQCSAEHLNSKFIKLQVNVTFEDRVNEAGVAQSCCNLCGDCVSGCNYGAKNTVLMNYLPDANNHGAEIFTSIDVRYVESRGDGFRVYFQVLGAGREKFDAPDQFVDADVVILAGGTLGSTEILLRSKEQGLGASTRLGAGFSGNGDVLGFAYNCDEEINGIGWGEGEKEEVDAVGPCITSAIDLRWQDNLNTGMILEEGSIPGFLRPILAPAFSVASDVMGVDTDSGWIDGMQEWARQTLSLLSGGRYGAVDNTQTYLVMTHDDSAGHMTLQDNRLRLSWPDVGEQASIAEANAKLLKATEALGGTYVKNPQWTAALGKSLTTVHPLGGCVMADKAEQGVVNHMGQVFRGAVGDAVYENLLVCDGAIVPRSVGVNPLLTISALAERNIELFAQFKGWQIDYDSSQRAPKSAAAAAGVQFTETMKGHVALGAVSYVAGRDVGQEQGGSFQFILTIVTNNMEAMLASPQHFSEMTGSVIAPLLSEKPLTVTDGRFQLFSSDESQALAKNMRYTMTLSSVEGRRFSFKGHKNIKDDPGFDLWSDTTTLYVTLKEISEGFTGSWPAASEAKGILRIELADFVTQARTIRALNTRTVVERLQTVARFGESFMGELYKTYGSVWAPSTVHDPAAKPRRRRSNRLPPAQIIDFQTGDGVRLRLTRHRAGKKGPVLLVPGMGTSTQAFTLDTVDVNFAEYLAAHGYDIWLFDYRASAALPASLAQFSLDEIGKFDYPAAIAQVCQLTGADSVQIVAHCVASAGLFVSLLGGHLPSGVRSIVASQFTPFVSTTQLIAAKSHLKLPGLLQALGVDVMSTEFDANSGFAEQVYDALLRLYPAEQGQLCDSPVCRRIRFMWGETFDHANLNRATHRAIHELFGDGNLTLFRHLAAVVRASSLVNSSGENVYMSQFSRLALPISIIQGGRNTLFLPEASQRSFEALQSTNGSHLYRRKVFEQYAHMDCFIGKQAAIDVFPYILSELERFNDS